MDVGRRIRDLRESRGMEQLELANRIDISQSKMNKIETGYQKRLEPELLAAISTVLNVTVDYIVGNSDNPHMTENEEFQAFSTNPELDHFFRDIAAGDADEQRELKQIFEIIKQRRKEEK